MPDLPRYLMFLAVSGFSASLAAESPVNLGDIDVVEQGDSRAANSGAYTTHGALDSGTSTITEKSIRAKQPGDIDTTELLKSQPFVQMDIFRNNAKPSDIQSLRPSDFSISGGNYYNNNIMVNGVQANSVMDVTNDNPYHFMEVAGQTSQTLYLDPALLDEIVVRDSNVSAEYGDFSGGVVELNIRQPKDQFGVTVSTGYQSDNMVEYRLDSDDKPTTAADIVPEPEFKKERYSVTLDLPVNEQLKLLAAYSRSESNVQYTKSEKYGSHLYHNGDLSENYLLKGVYTFSDTLQAEAQITYSPYESESENPTGIANLITSQSDGLASYFKLSGISNGVNWETQLSYSHSDSSREAPSTSFSWPSSSNTINWCDSSNCSEGGFGDIDQWQEDLTWSAKGSMLLGMGELRFGGEWRKVTAFKERTETNRAYSRGRVFAQLDCPSGDPACLDNDIILEQYSAYDAFKAKVDVESEALWGEYSVELGEVSLRAGLRYSHEDFLDNHNVAPRFTAAWEFMPGASVSIGANRYYDKAMVSYAIREQYPDRPIYRRDTSTDGSGVEQVEPWSLYMRTRPTSYSQSDLDTPFSDELAITFTFATPLDGELRLRGIKRDARDQFSSSPSSKIDYESILAGNPRASTYNSRVVTNDGRTDYEALSIEWQAKWGNHLFAINGTWSETISYGGSEDYFDIIDNDELYDEKVYYQNSLITKRQLWEIQDRSNFATPFRAYASLTSEWLQGRLMTNLSVHYRGSYEQIDDSSENIYIDGVRYDIYEKEVRKPFTSVDLNTQLEVFKSEAGTVKVEAKVTNLLNSMPYTGTTSSAPYQEGRTLWLGATYSY